MRNSPPASDSVSVPCPAANASLPIGFDPARWLVLLLGLLLAGACGCASPGAGVSSGRGDAIHELHLFVMPVPLLPGQGGVGEGFTVRVFASPRDRAAGVPIRAGTLDILMFEGALAAPDPRGLKPARTWSFPAARLPELAMTSSLGVGYQLTLGWEGTRPTQNRLTIMGRLTAPSGSICHTVPSTLVLASP